MAAIISLSWNLIILSLFDFFLIKSLVPLLYVPYEIIKRSDYSHAAPFRM